MTLSEPIQRRPLTDELADRLRALIVEGALPPAEKLNEKALCEQFGVSRTPLREALRLLAAEGLVALTPNRGAAVSPLTREDLAETFPVLGALEALAAERAAERIDAAGLAHLETLQTRMEAEHAAGNRPDYFRANEDIHAVIRAAAANPTLAQMIATLDARMRRARFRANASPARWAEAVAEHRAILEALSAKDGPRAGDLMRAHIANKHAALTRALPD